MSGKRSIFRGLFFMFLSICLAGCGTGRAGRDVDVGELGFSMTLPSGWQVDRQEPRRFFAAADPGECFGDVIRLGTGGLPLIYFVDRQIASGNRVEEPGGPAPADAAEGGPVSSTETVFRFYGDINGANSVELVLRREGYHLSTFWLLRGDEVIRVSFRVPDAQFPRWQDQLRTAGKSITLR